MNNPLTDPQEELEAKAKALWKRGYQAQMEGQVDPAIQFYRDSLSFFPTAEAHTYLGWAYSFQGNFQDAIQECLKAIETDPSFGNPYNDIGAYFIELGKWEEAVPWLEKAVKSDRYEPRHYPHFNLARIHLHFKKTREALEELKKALDYYPGYAPALQTMAQMQSRFN